VAGIPSWLAQTDSIVHAEVTWPIALLHFVVSTLSRGATEAVAWQIAALIVAGEDVLAELDQKHSGFGSSLASERAMPELKATPLAD